MTSQGEGRVWKKAYDQFVLNQWEKGVGATKIAEGLNERFGTSFSRGAVLGRSYRIRNPQRESSKPAIVMTKEEREALAQKRAQLMKEAKKAADSSEKELLKKIAARSDISLQKKLALMKNIGLNVVDIARHYEMSMNEVMNTIKGKENVS